MKRKYSNPIIQAEVDKLYANVERTARLIPAMQDTVRILNISIEKPKASVQRRSTDNKPVHAFRNGAWIEIG